MAKTERNFEYNNRLHIHIIVQSARSEKAAETIPGEVRQNQKNEHFSNKM